MGSSLPETVLRDSLASLRAMTFTASGAARADGDARPRARSRPGPRSGPSLRRMPDRPPRRRCRDPIRNSPGPRPRSSATARRAEASSETRRPRRRPLARWTCDGTFLPDGRQRAGGNLWDRARFTGYDLDGGYAEYSSPTNATASCPSWPSPGRPALCARAHRLPLACWPATPAAWGLRLEPRPASSARSRSPGRPSTLPPGRATARARRSHVELGAVWAGDAAKPRRSWTRSSCSHPSAS